MDQSLEIDGDKIDFEFVEKPWIKNTYLKFVDDRVVVVSRNRKMMNKIVSKHRHWISKHYREIKSTVKLFDSNSIFYRSRKYPVSFVSSSSRPKADVLDDRLVVYAPSKESAEKAIDRIIRKDTERLVGEIALAKSSSINERLECIKVRKCRKWGACKSDRAITFNYMVSMLPADLQNYVISHEVAHLKEMNHSRRFWEVVSGLCPDYRKLRKELKNYDNARRKVYLAENAA